MLTATQKHEIHVYGMTRDELVQEIENSFFHITKDYGMLAMSMMSDAQEMMCFTAPTPERINQQRQVLNCAKYVLANYVMEKEVA